MVCGALVLSGCGASSHPSSGAGVFATDCTACHSLDGRDHPHLMGGDLLHFRATRLQLSQLVAEMPVRRPLRGAELTAVVGYVRRVTR
jgi:mono/diheme cytochrome c family protein